MNTPSAPGNGPRPPDDMATASSPGAALEMPPAFRHWWFWVGLLAVLTLGMFGDVLFAPWTVVLSDTGTDLTGQFIHWRSFGFGELRRGHLALWNPHLFSGAPFFGGFQSALLYPPNALFLVLPLAPAINWSIALHAFLAGAFTFAWATRRGLAPPGAFLAAMIFMFCGANFLHIYAGHLTNLCAFVWAPLIFLAIDGLFEAPSLGWSLLGMFALAMQILAGHPQYVFYTGVAAALYGALCMLQTRHPGRFVLGVAGIVGGGVALSAVQLFTSLSEAPETLRSAGVSYAFAGMFSFPPENFLTLLAPDFFGNSKALPYWGRCYWWEMSLFIGVSGLALAVVGAVQGERRQRRFSITLVVLLLLLALGARTPLFDLLYHWAPGFNKFRGNSKFIFLASLYLALLAGIGFNELLKGRRPARAVAWSAGGIGLLLLAGAVWIRSALPSANAPLENRGWHSVVLALWNTQETNRPRALYDDPAFVFQSAHLASRGLLVGGVLAVTAALLLLGCRRHRSVAWALGALAAIELSVFARGSLEHFDLDQAADPPLKQWLETHPGDYRILNLREPNAALSLGAYDIWGYDPTIMRRYAEFVTFSQGANPDRATQYVFWKRDDPLLGLLRCRFLFPASEDRLNVIEHTNALPHLMLVQRYRVLAKRNEILSTLTNVTFNPREEVILEEVPDPRPVVSPEAGTARIVEASADRLTIQAEVKSPTILFITDTFAKGWGARALPGSVQARYQVMPADYCLRAIPLAAGHHSLRLEYRPPGFRLGEWTSLMSWGAFVVLLGLASWRNSRKRWAASGSV